jgi:hypothetical protein
MAGFDVASMLTGSAPQLSGAQRAGRALSGLSAGLMGKGAEYLTLMQAQDEATAKQSQQLSEQRLKAMALDAQRVNQLLQGGDIQGALRVVDNRTAAIKQLGGDPSDTLRIRQLITAGEIPAAQAEIGGFLNAAQQYGLIEAPKQPEIIPQSAISPNGQVAMRGADGSISSQAIPGFQAESLPPETKVVGDYLVDAATGDILFDASSGGGSAEHGLTPLIFRDPATGKYAPYLPTKAGGMTALQIPEGQEFVPDAARMGYNPANINERAGAEASATLTNAPILGEAARQQTLAETSGQRAAGVATKEDQFKLLDDVIGEVKKQSGFWTTGMAGSLMRRIAGTDAADMAANLDTLQAAAGFEKLQEMRDNSPTGGALGSVTERELQLLQATWGSLAQSQSEEQFDKNLARFQEQIKDSWGRVAKAYERDYGRPYFASPGAGASTPAGSAPQTSGAVLRFDAN